MFILDSDHFTLFMLGNPEVVRRVNERGSEVAISIITVEEELSGWYTRLRKSNNSERLIRAYAGMYRAVQHFKLLDVMPFSPDAMQRFEALRKTYRRTGKLDLSIAAIVLEFNATLITRNRIDFEQIDGLSLEDWSQPDV
ncbi:MAG: type II toxin-antitoxin system VapC family toxin [Planctomycetaceae bacterium]